MKELLRTGPTPGLVATFDLIWLVLHYANFAEAALDDIETLRHLTSHQDLLPQFISPTNQLIDNRQHRKQRHPSEDVNLFKQDKSLLHHQ